MSNYTSLYLLSARFVTSPTWYSISPISDRIIAQGSSDVWTWVKYANGTAMCWAFCSTSDSAFGTFNNVNAYAITQYYPFEFTETPLSFVTFHAVGQYAQNGYTHGDTTVFRAVGYGGGSPDSFLWHLLAIGKWNS